jgi:fructose-1,6-bisphosphatase-3
MESYYLSLLKEKFPQTEDVMTELINLEAINGLPKGTELYISDIHGEYEAFDHILRIGSGNVKEKITELYNGKLTKKEINHLTLLVAYPKYALKNLPEFQEQEEQVILETIEHLINILRFTAAKYTRSKVRKSLPANYQYIIEELLYADYSLPEKVNYARQIIRHLCQLNKTHDFIAEVAATIQHLVIDRLHVVGDVFDRGNSADKVMDRLMAYPTVDFQWGNHDILWMGGFFGNAACLMTLLRIAARYGYLLELEKSYSINLRPLFLFANETYKGNPAFTPKGLEEKRSNEKTIEMERVHQALAIIQFKLEEQLIQRRPEFEMDHRALLSKINDTEQLIEIDGTSYELENSCFQTIDFEQPQQLTEKEQEVVDALVYSIQHSEKLQKHMRFLLEKGSAYLVYNFHLLFHGCIPLTEEGELLALELEGKRYKGKELLNYMEQAIRKSAQSLQIKTDLETDFIWYAWAGPKSPLFGKDKMTTFERYFIKEKEAHKETKNPYYTLRNEKAICEMILNEFNCQDERATIINGHTPVEVKKGEEPIKAEGKLFVIDGGLSSAYQKKTGIAGYSLLNNSFGFQLVTHLPFQSVAYLFENQFDGTYVKRVIDKDLPRILIHETTIGKELKRQIEELQKLLRLYQS